jgi:hypothetical protein
VLTEIELQLLWDHHRKLATDLSLPESFFCDYSRAVERAVVAKLAIQPVSYGEPILSGGSSAWLDTAIRNQEETLAGEKRNSALVPIVERNLYALKEILEVLSTRKAIAT